MRITSSRTSQAGFTLVELAIVLAIAGLLFAGIWGLIASGQEQLRAKREADNIRQIIDATRTFLAGAGDPSTPGGSWARTPTLIQPNGTREIVIGPATGTNPDRTLVGGGFLPDSPGSATDAFPYAGSYTGHRYRVVAQRLQTSPALPANDSSTFRWRFMVVTQPDPAIPPADREIISDKQGGAISAMIGSEGGFMYTQTIGQCVANQACGTGASWTENMGNWPPLSFESGYMSARVQMLPNTDTSSPWLARLNIGIPEYNRMFTTLRMNSQDISKIRRFSQSYSSLNSSLSMQIGAPNPTDTDLFMAAGTDSPNLRIDSAGVNDASSLDLVNSQYTFTRITGTASTILINDATGNLLNPVLFLNGGGTATRWVALEFIYNSDARLKTNIKPIEGALDKLLQIRGDTFNWKKNGKAGMGLVAQDVEKVFPELVAEASADGMKGVQYGNLVAPIIEALRQLKQENDALRARLDKLESGKAAH